MDKIHSTLRTQTTDFVHGFVKFQLKTGLSDQVNERRANTLLYSLVLLYSAIYCCTNYFTLQYTCVHIFVFNVRLHNSTMT